MLINDVDYCHSRGVFHRDLKVNFFLDSSVLHIIPCFVLLIVPFTNLISWKFSSGPASG
ncbi:hypothetical protein IFM89_008650, partial [Coptis chinensis]